MKSKVNELLENVSKIENGTITLPELEYTVDLTRELYEKLIVIRHKVYEQGILEQPAFDLSPLEIDDAISEEKPLAPDTSSTETLNVPEPVSEEINREDENIIDFSTNLSNESKSNDLEQTVFEQPAVPQEELIDHSDDLERPQPEISYDAAPTVDLSSWTDKIKEVESHIPSNFSLSKLDTLIGSFGLNERLQFINELFGGSSEAFSEAVKVLDARTGMDSAREKIAEFAASNNWGDADNETITDFVAKIKRRYA
jgi:hypothetical protein